jgi:hypothetical protein
MRTTTLARDQLVAIARAVETQGGDMSDVHDLVAVWERVARRNGERADLIRREARELAQRMRTEDER